MTNLYYPIAIKLRNRRVLVVGGGKVAERKIKTLLHFGASVRVISPKATPWLVNIANRGEITWIKRTIRASDTNSADIIIAATSDEVVNKRIRDWARRKKILVNVVDCAELSDFISPAIFHSFKTVVAVYTQGKDPVLSRDLKNFLKENWHEVLRYRNRLQNNPTRNS